jgi:hypothetical protein
MSCSALTMEGSHNLFAVSETSLQLRPRPTFNTPTCIVRFLPRLPRLPRATLSPTLSHPSSIRRPHSHLLRSVVLPLASRLRDMSHETAKSFAVAHPNAPLLALEPQNFVFSGPRDHAVSAPCGSTFPATQHFSSSVTHKATSTPRCTVHCGWHALTWRRRIP